MPQVRRRLRRPAGVVSLAILAGWALAALAASPGEAAAGARRDRGPDARPAALPPVATFSIVAADPDHGEVGVAVASRFFAVGTVVPWARAGVGAVATQSFANTTFGPRGLELLAGGRAPDEVLASLLASDAGAARRQVGVVAADGRSATFTGEGCNPWAGGRQGPGYAVQGNILAGEPVVLAMERAFLSTTGSLARRLHAALAAGEAAGGDSRGRQSAALLVARERGGYGGFTDRFIDLRVDDHADPVGELGRLLALGEVNGRWNLAWTAFTEKRYGEALPLMEQTAAAAREDGAAVLPEVLYDLAVIRAHAGQLEAGLAALTEAVGLNPGLAAAARGDEDVAPLRRLEGFAAAMEAAAQPAPAPGG